MFAWMFGRKAVCPECSRIMIRAKTAENQPTAFWMCSWCWDWGKPKPKSEVEELQHQLEQTRKSYDAYREQATKEIGELCKSNQEKQKIIDQLRSQVQRALEYVKKIRDLTQQELPQDDPRATEDRSGQPRTGSRPPSYTL